jgi:hypothetical protein
MFTVTVIRILTVWEPGCYECCVARPAVRLSINSLFVWLLHIHGPLAVEGTAEGVLTVSPYSVSQTRSEIAFLPSSYRSTLQAALRLCSNRPLVYLQHQGAKSICSTFDSNSILPTRWDQEDFCSPHQFTPAMGPPCLLYDGYRVSFPREKRPGSGVNNPPHVATRLKKE